MKKTLISLIILGFGSVFVTSCTKSTPAGSSVEANSGENMKMAEEVMGHSEDMSGAVRSHMTIMAEDKDFAHAVIDANKKLAQVIDDEDKKLAHALVGKWKGEDNQIFTFDKDGSYASPTAGAQGDWALDGTKLVITFSDGHKVYETIMSLNNGELVFMRKGVPNECARMIE